jgi:uncharacterized protein
MARAIDPVPEPLAGDIPAHARRDGLLSRRPVSTYFALTFLISWGGVLLVVGVGHGRLLVTPEQLEPLLPYAVLAMLAGPVAAGPVMIGLVDGRAGLREFRARLLRWRVEGRWYAVALLTAPLIVLAALLALSPLSADFRPELLVTDAKMALLLAGVAVGLVAGLEELGWTGFAAPRLRRRYGILTVGLIVGVLWAAWHVPVTVAGSGAPAGGLALAVLLPPMVFYATVLLGFRVLMVWVYDRTESLLVAVLMHATLTASTVVILAPRATGAPALIAYHLLLAGGLWAFVGIVIAVNHRQHQPSSTSRQHHVSGQGTG